MAGGRKGGAGEGLERELGPTGWLRSSVKGRGALRLIPGISIYKLSLEIETLPPLASVPGPLFPG